MIPETIFGALSGSSIMLGVAVYQGVVDWKTALCLAGMVTIAVAAFLSVAMPE